MTKKTICRFSWMPGVLVLAVIVLYYLTDRPATRELLPIWIPWSAIMLCTATLAYAAFAYATLTERLWLRLAIIATLYTVALFGILTLCRGGDALSVLPIGLQGVLALAYAILCLRVTFTRDFTIVRKNG